MGVEFIYHMCLHSEWEEALSTGLYLGSALDRKDGFIHFSTSEPGNEARELDNQLGAANDRLGGVNMSHTNKLTS